MDVFAAQRSDSVRDRHETHRRTLKVLALLAVLAGALPASAAADCGAAADVDPASPGASLPAAQTATLCLLNAQRANHQVRRLRFNRKLALAGMRHARDMVDEQYFSHTDPSGDDFVQRIMATDYVTAKTSSWALGENLAWGSWGESTPREIVSSWMTSTRHRANILQPRFREAGVAIVVGAPESGADDAATYAVEFGAVGR
jgi:uncharacterized protein YkwD